MPRRYTYTDLCYAGDLLTPPYPAQHTQPQHSSQSRLIWQCVWRSRVGRRGLLAVYSKQEQIEESGIELSVSACWGGEPGHEVSRDGPGLSFTPLGHL